jgi:Vitamin K-dependent gamma-carboxylase
MSERATSTRYLAYMRVGIGALLLLRTTPLLAPFEIPWLRSTAPLLGWPTGGFSLGFLPVWSIQALCVLRTLAALLLMLGIAGRVSGVVCGVAGFLVALQYPLGFFFTIHLLYQAAILLAFTDGVSVLALAPSPPRESPLDVWLLRGFVASIYFWAGVYKLRPDWLDGRTLGLFHQPTALSGRLADLLFAQPWLPAVAAKVIATLELSLGPLLLWVWSRRFALPVAYALHVTLELTAHPDLLGWGMMVLLLCFLPAAGERASQAQPH